MYPKGMFAFGSIQMLLFKMSIEFTDISHNGCEALKILVRLCKLTYQLNQLAGQLILQ